MCKLFGRCAINTVPVMHKFQILGEIVAPLLGTRSPMWDILCAFVAPMGLNICVNFGEFGTNTMVSIHKFPPFLGVMPQKGEAAQFGEHIVWRKSYCGPTCLGKFFSRCAINTVPVTHKFPILGEILAPL